MAANHSSLSLSSWMQRVPLLKSSEESAWLFHEIARAKWELRDYTEALEYGNKSLDAARDAGDQSWQLCASMLVAQAEGERTLVVIHIHLLQI